ncbi:hypothetical protein NQU49_26625, partial [Escherichia coli]|uniref:hypothetical protein n=1 Tax=Escherichia coli TaxID=562 RepID=UPI002117E988
PQSTFSVFKLSDSVSLLGRFDCLGNFLVDGEYARLQAEDVPITTPIETEQTIQKITKSNHNSES